MQGLYNGLFAMADRQTGSVWTHYDGSVLNGPLAGSGSQLTIAPLLHTSWAEWVERHPDTLVLDWYEEFANRYRHREPGAAGMGQNFQRTVLNWDDRLPENELVVGVNVADAYRAYVLADFPTLTALSDEVGGVAVVVFIDGETTTGLAYRPELDGQSLTFSMVDGVIQDESGSVWDMTGRAISGPLAGAQLPFVTSFVTEWYGWAAYHPATTIYGR